MASQVTSPWSETLDPVDIPLLDRGTVPAIGNSVRILGTALAVLLALGITRGEARADARQDTDRALAAERKLDAEVATAKATRVALDARYQSELRKIDRLKKQRGSWRRDRELRESLASSLETAKKLEAITAQLTRASASQGQARRLVAAAVASELASATDPPRLAMLQRERARLAPPPARDKKIVLPELEIDPLADPEELEQQALAIRQSEGALARQVALLEDRSRRFDQVAELRRQHERAESLAERDDARARRGAGVPLTRSNEDASPADSSTDGAGSGSGGGFPSDPPPTSLPPPNESSSGRTDTLVGGANEVALLAESSAVLGEVIDASALEALRKAQSSSDPKVRAAAAKQARDAAAAKLDHLRKQRALIEARARSLRQR